MCSGSLARAPSRAALDRRRGVAAAAHPALGADEVPTAPASSQERGRDVDPAPPPALRVRMDKELVALHGLLKRAKLLPRSAGFAPPAENKSAPAPRPSEAPAAVSSAAKRRASPPPKSSAATTEAAYLHTQSQITAPAAANSDQQQSPAQRAAAAKNSIAHLVAPNKPPPAEEPEAPKQQQQLARAAAREEFRRMLLEMEKAALPDERIYPEELEELGIPFEFMVTRTRKQAWLEDHAKKVGSVGV